MCGHGGSWRQHSGKEISGTGAIANMLKYQKVLRLAAKNDAEQIARQQMADRFETHTCFETSDDAVILFSSDDDASSNGGQGAKRVSWRAARERSLRPYRLPAGGHRAHKWRSA